MKYKRLWHFHTPHRRKRVYQTRGTTQLCQVRRLWPADVTLTPNIDLICQYLAFLTELGSLIGFMSKSDWYTAVWGISERYPLNDTPIWAWGCHWTYFFTPNCLSCSIVQLWHQARLSTIFRTRVSIAGFYVHGRRPSWILQSFQGTVPSVDVQMKLCFIGCVLFTLLSTSSDFEVQTTSFTSVSSKGCIPKMIQRR